MFSRRCPHQHLPECHPHFNRLFSTAAIILWQKVDHQQWVPMLHVTFLRTSVIQRSGSTLWEPAILYYFQPLSTSQRKADHFRTWGSLDAGDQLWYEYYILPFTLGYGPIWLSLGIGIKPIKLSAILKIFPNWNNYECRFLLSCLTLWEATRAASSVIPLPVLFLERMKKNWRPKRKYYQSITTNNDQF